MYAKKQVGSFLHCGCGGQVTKDGKGWEAGVINIRTQIRRDSAGL
jgi:hypothetical protein